MRARLQRLAEKLRYSFWFVPSLMAVGAILLSILSVWMDRQVTREWVRGLAWIYPTGTDGSREILSSIAGSMVTVTGVVFSITTVALSLASQQMGPRLLRSFMRDTGNQIVLGTFIATFLYCLLVLRTIHGTGEQIFVPRLSVALAVMLAMASLGVLIYFIHHVAMSIQAPTVIESVGRDFLAAIDNLYPVRIGAQPHRRSLERIAEEVPAGFENEAGNVLAPETGYLQAIDGETLMGLAAKHDLLIRVVARPGHFVIAGHPLVKVYPHRRLTKTVVKHIHFAFVIGGRRTPTQDVEFALDQLVEVAVRALSAGINDPFTAMSCIDWVGAGLHELARKQPPSKCRVDDEGRLRVIAPMPSFEGLVGAGLNQLRQHARHDVAVTCRLLESLAQVADACRDDRFRQILLHHATMIYRNTTAWPEEQDRQDAERRFQTLVECLSHRQQPE